MILVTFISPVILYTIFSFLRVNFLTLKSFSSKFDNLTALSSPTTIDFGGLFKLYFQVISVILLAVVPLQNDVSLLVSSNVFTIMFLLSVNLILIGVGSSKNLFFIPLSVLFSLLLLPIFYTQNLVQLYLILEISAYSTLLFLTIYGVSEFNMASNKNVSALIISFMLNFITSLFIFTYILAVEWFSGYLNNYYNSHQGNYIISILVLFVIFLKMGTGPWLSGNVISYSGYTISYLAVYTGVALTSITPVILALLPFNIPTILITITLVSLVLFISKTLHTVTTVKSLFAYSTVILHMYLLLLFLI